MMIQEYKLPSLNEFWKMLRNHDWSYEYSDDHSVWRKGQQQFDEIQNVVKNGSVEYKELFNQYSEYAWGRSKEQPVIPARTKEEQQADKEMISVIADKLQEIVQEVYLLEEDQIISAEQLWKFVNPASSILYKMHELAEEKNSERMKDTVAFKGYKNIIKQLAGYCKL